MTAKVNKNNSARKKLIPAIAMLTVSAMTLASSTYLLRTLPLTKAFYFVELG